MKIALALITIIVVLIAFFAVLPILTFAASVFFKILIIVAIALGVGVLVGKFWRRQ